MVAFPTVPTGRSWQWSSESSFLKNQIDQDELDLLHRVFQPCLASCYVHPIVWI